MRTAVAPPVVIVPLGAAAAKAAAEFEESFARVREASPPAAEPPLIRWNPSLSKHFDVATEQFPAASAEEALVSKYFGVEIKHLERRRTKVMSVRMGAYLTAVDDVLRSWSLDDIRNLDWQGRETSPLYEGIQLNSTQHADFLVDGMRFLREGDPTESPRVTLRVQPRWYGVDVTAYGVRQLGTAEILLNKIGARAREINFLKGEAFSLSGQFIPKTNESFDDLFLDKTNQAAVARIIQLVNERGKALENRGVILMGPPGTGKTLSARIVRNQVNATFIWVSSRDFHYAGSFGGFSEAFDLARECAPSVLVFEDVDNWLYDTTVDLIKTEMDGVARSSGVVTMLTTNYPELLPAALIDRPGRFHDVLMFALPDPAARKRMLLRWLPDLPEADVAKAVEATKGYSGAHVRELARFATIIAEQDGLTLPKAVAAALLKLAEQRDLITNTQRSGSRYKMPTDLLQKSGIRLERKTEDVSTADSIGRMHKAYAALEVKDFVETPTGRKFSGMATTPTPDRVGDIIEPLGVQFQNPMPLLLFHDPTQPVGEVVFGTPTRAGVPFEATIPTVTEPGIVKDLTDKAAHLVKYKLVRKVSVGFRSFADFVERITDGGLRFLKTEILETSLVPIPANPDAVISSVKTFPRGTTAAAPGQTSFRVLPAGASASPPSSAAQKGAAPMHENFNQRITDYENSRAAKEAARRAIQTKVAQEGRTKDEAEREEFSTLTQEINAIDAELADLRILESASAKAATTVVVDGRTPVAAGAQRGTNVIEIKSNLPKGTGFTRYVMALAASRGARMEALEYAKRWEKTTPEVVQVLKAAVAAGTTTDSNWAAPLVVYQNLAQEFIELLRPETIIGRIQGFRQVPFNVTMPRQTSGSTVGWVGQGKPKPVGKLQFDQVSLGMAKAAGIVVIAEELARSSSPSAEATVRQDLIETISTFLDAQFIDPSVAEVANVSPAAITNGATVIDGTGVTSAAFRADVASAFAVLTAAGLKVARAVFVMTETQAMRLSMVVNAFGQPEFPTISAAGGTLFGLPVITSENIPAEGGSPNGKRIVILIPNEILMADENGVAIDVSREASVQMDTAPDDPATASTVMVSLWQNNLVGLRAERFINWKRRRTGSVVVIENPLYTG